MLHPALTAVRLELSVTFQLPNRVAQCMPVGQS